MRVSPLKAGYKRFIKISRKSANFKIPPGADAETIKQLEKICSFKVTEVCVEYAETSSGGDSSAGPGGKKNKEFKMTSLTGVDDIENFQ